ncbi:MAG: NAD(P)H-dependent oxidoreductase [Saprospiraceae bacterium]|nr:NAD(P)H-dependent oxidoreductase [Saprospiraceae bacterium]
MITVIIGTNRADNIAQYFAIQYVKELQTQQSEEVQLLDLAAIPHDWFHPDMYILEKQSASLRAIQDQYILPANKFVFVVPEYNGGNPGALKAFIDGCSIRQYKGNFNRKKALLAGVASGKAGNLRGMDHLTGVLNYLGTVVMPTKNPYSEIELLLNDNKEITDPLTLKRIRDHVQEFIEF